MIFTDSGSISISAGVRMPRTSLKKPRVNCSNSPTSMDTFEKSSSSSAAVDAPERMAHAGGGLPAAAVTTTGEKCA